MISAIPGDTTSWNDLIDYDCKLTRKNTEFWNVRLFFDGYDGLCYELTPQQVFCAYFSAEEAFDELRMLTCEMTDASGDEYLIEILRIPPYSGSQIAYALKDIDGEFNYVWDGDVAHSISTMIYNVSTKALSNYFKKDMKWSTLLSSAPALQAYGSYKILDYSLWQLTPKGSVGILFDETPEEAADKAIMMICDVYWEEQVYTLYYKWIEPFILEAKVEDFPADFPCLREVADVLKETIIQVLRKGKIKTHP